MLRLYLLNEVQANISDINEDNKVRIIGLGTFVFALFESEVCCFRALPILLAVVCSFGKASEQINAASSSYWHYTWVITMPANSGISAGTACNKLRWSEVLPVPGGFFRAHINWFVRWAISGQNWNALQILSCTKTFLFSWCWFLYRWTRLLSFPCDFPVANTWR